MWARRTLSCFVKSGARLADDPELLGGGQPAPTGPESSGEAASGATVELEMGRGEPAPNEKVDDASSTWLAGAVQPA